MLPPEAVQVIVELSLAAIMVGAMLGFLFSRMLEKALDLVLYVFARRARIDAARNRVHALVPPIK